MRQEEKYIQISYNLGYGIVQGTKIILLLIGALFAGIFAALITTPPPRPRRSMKNEERAFTAKERISETEQSRVGEVIELVPDVLDGKFHDPKEPPQYRKSTNFDTETIVSNYKLCEHLNCANSPTGDRKRFEVSKEGQRFCSSVCRTAQWKLKNNKK